VKLTVLSVRRYIYSLLHKLFKGVQAGGVGENVQQKTIKSGSSQAQWHSNPSTQEVETRGL
jgi:hypothetical protein